MPSHSFLYFPTFSNPLLPVVISPDSDQLTSQGFAHLIICDNQRDGSACAQKYDCRRRYRLSGPYCLECCVALVVMCRISLIRSQCLIGFSYFPCDGNCTESIDWNRSQRLSYRWHCTVRFSDQSDKGLGADKHECELRCNRSS